jgi:alpha-galactosidase
MRNLVLLFTALALSLPAQTFMDVRTRPHPNAGARFSSELTIYDEGMLDGRLVGRYWSPIGRLRAEKEMEPKEYASPWADAFLIEIGGNAVRQQWTWVGAKSEGATTVVELKHASEPLRVRVHTKLDRTPVLMRWLEITNTSDKPMPLSGLAPLSGQLWRIWWQPQTFPKKLDQPFRLARFRHSGWGEEGDFGWSALAEGEFAFDNGRTGKSGWGNPFFIARNEAAGDYFVCALGWSGEWKMEFLRQQRAAEAVESLYFRARVISTDPVMRVIAPGETVTSPVVHIGHLTGELDDVVQAMHDHIRRSVIAPQPAGRAQLVQDNHWGYQSGVETEEGIRGVVDAAASVGVELFIFDAGWYGNKRNDWGNQVGDWRPGSWLPNGLKPISDYVHSKGLLFGLWLEAESIGKSTKLREQHPDFVLLRNGQPAFGGRALDLTKPEVAAWLEAELTRVFTEYGVDLFRLDYNVTDSRGGGNRVRDGFLENTTWRYYEAFYPMLDRLRKKFPKMIFENCAGGGARTDLGILRYMNTTWISDVSVLPKSVKILNGMTMLLPPEICNRTYGTQWDIQRQHGDLDTQLRVTLFAHPTGIGIAPSLADLNPANARRVRHAIELYKTFVRPMLSTSRVYHHTSEMPYETPGGWLVLEYAARDRARAYAGMFRLSGEGEPEYVFRPRGLRAGARYRVTFDNSGDSITKTGYDLRQEGIRVRLASGIRSELLLFEEVKP